MQAPHGKGSVHHARVVSSHAIVLFVCGEDRKRVSRAGAVRYVKPAPCYKGIVAHDHAVRVCGEDRGNTCRDRTEREACAMLQSCCTRSCSSFVVRI